MLDMGKQNFIIRFRIINSLYRFFLMSTFHEKMILI